MTESITIKKLFPSWFTRVINNLRNLTVAVTFLKRYFTYEYKRAFYLGKLYLLLKIHKRPFDMSGRLVISNCRKYTEKVFLY